MRVLHGLTGAAGQPWTISRAQRRLGITADCVLVGDSKFGYKADRHLALPEQDDQVAQMSAYLAEVGKDYDVFHFYFRPFFRVDPRRLIFPTGLDLLALRAAGKVVVFHYRGSEVRTAERFRQLSPYNYVDENPDRLFDKFPEDVVRAFGDFVRGVANAVLVPDPELQSYVPGSQVVARAVDLSEWSNVGVPDDDDPLVLHAPSRRAVKGTDALIDAVDALRSEGLRFRFQLVEDLAHHDARELYRQASIVVDQLRIGWYGVLAVESMALGKATVAYIREDLAHHLPSPLPLASANPTNIKDVLRDLIVDAAKRKELGRRGRAYCEQVHDADKIAAQLVEVYRQAAEHPQPVSLEACMDYLVIQQEQTSNLYDLLLTKALGPSNSVRRLLRLMLPLRVRRAILSATRRSSRRNRAASDTLEST